MYVCPFPQCSRQLASTSLVVVLTDARPDASFELVSLVVVLADARPAAPLLPASLVVLAPTSVAVVLKDA